MVKCSHRPSYGHFPCTRPSRSAPPSNLQHAARTAAVRASSVRARAEKSWRLYNCGNANFAGACSLRRPRSCGQTKLFRLPFHAIIARENPSGDQAVLLADDLDELQPLMNVPHDCAVQRDAASLSAAMREMRRFSSRSLFVDPFYDPFNARYKSTFRECLGIVRSLNADAACEIHYRYHDHKPANDEIEREATHLFPSVVPKGMKVTIFCWRQKDDGEDFHARYLLSDRGGIAIDAGFSAEGNHQRTDMHLMSYDLSQEKLKTFARGATFYDLVEPIIKVAKSSVFSPRHRRTGYQQRRFQR
jgi:hypothetical protein